MSTNHTSNYNLNQWVKSDRVLMSEFNADNAKIDAALKAQDTAIAGKASASALSALQSTVNSHTSELAKKGNCQIYVTSYTGTGKCEEANANSLSFPAVPEAVYIGQGGNWLVLLRGDTYTWGMGSSGGAGAVTVAWNGKTVRWHSTNARAQMNSSSTTYSVIALIKVS